MANEILDFDFLEQFIVNGKWQFYPIAFDAKRKFVVGYDVKTKKAHYYYQSPLTDEMVFDFDMLSDCCDEYAEWATDILAKTHHDVVPYETTFEYYETLIKQKDERNQEA